MRYKILHFISALFVSVLTVMWAQTMGGTLTGRVTAGNGAGIPNAAVTVTNVGTYNTQKVLTGRNGEFTVTNLPPGTYRVDIETAGYKRTTRQNLELVAGGPTTINFTLEAGSTAESVEIKGHAPMVQGANGEVVQGLTERTLHELPVVDRNHQQLVGLQTGITPPVAPLNAAVDPDRNRYFSAIGQSPTVNQWELDNVNNSEQFRGTAIRVQPVENVQTMNISTSTQSADKGFNGGANVNDVSRPGTNGLHGSLFEFYSGNQLRARAPFNIAGNPDPRLTYNQFGGTIGGPIVRDKTFFFGSYEGTYNNGANTQVSTVPVPAAVTGNFASIPGLVIYNPFTGTAAGANRTPFSGNVIPSFSINANNQTIARLIPAPNVAGFANNFVSNVPYQIHSNKADGRIDQHFSDTTAFFLRYGYTNDWSFNGSPLGNIIGSSMRGRLIGQNVVADVNHEITKALITDFRFGYNRYDQRLFGANNPFDLGFNLPGVNISGLSGIGTPANLPEHGIDNNFDWVWSWNWTHANHNVKWGADVRRFRVDGFTDTLFGSQFGPFGTSYFGPGATMSLTGPGLGANSQFYNAFAAFLVNAPGQTGMINYFSTPTIRQTQYAVWLGDTIQLMPRVSLDLGVRYEVYSPLEPARAGGAAFFNPANNTFNFAGIGGTGMHNSTYDTDAVAPRIGLAAHLTEHTVFRGGYAINYFEPPYAMSGFMPAIYGSAFGVQGGFTTAPFGVSTPAPPLANGLPAGNLPATIVPRHQDTPYLQNFSAQIQQEFKSAFVASIGYVGALGRHLPFIENLNTAMPGSGVAGLPFGPSRTANTYLYDNGLTSNYNSLQVSLSKRFAEGLSFTTAYTWSKALGYTAPNGFLLNPFNLGANYGPLAWDRQHVLTFSHLWEIPWGRHGNTIVQTLLGGWQLNGIFTWATGTPMTITADSLGCNCPGLAVMANLNGSPFVEGGTQFLNPAAFSAPAPGQFGSLGRGAIRGEGFHNYDMSLFKNFHVRDRFTLELRGEAFNITNSPHWANPMTNINGPGFGERVSLLNGYPMRQLNVGARLLF